MSDVLILIYSTLKPELLSGAHSLHQTILLLLRLSLLSGIGTLRRNLDPFEQHDDPTLNNALRAAGLFSLQEDLGEARLTLDSNIASGGGNLSVGQRQVLALARAIVRGSKLLILDEGELGTSFLSDSFYFYLFYTFLSNFRYRWVLDDKLFFPLWRFFLFANLYIFRLQDGFYHTSYFAAPNEFRHYYHHCCSSIANDYGC
jgi:hypothetical protein